MTNLQLNDEIGQLYPFVNGIIIEGFGCGKCILSYVHLYIQT